ncbi:MAG: SURF1 family protein [Actinobacteria bacterium]|nr:SURF1 family protein [Actinomycetota bacterium]
MGSTAKSPAGVRALARNLRFLATPQWVALTVLMAALIPLFWHLSTWQFHRLDDRRESNSSTASAISQTPRDINQVLSAQPSDSIADWTPVRLRGRWVPDSTVYARKHWREDRMGFYVLTRLRLTGGEIAVVRGFTPASRSASETPQVAAPPNGLVEIRGWLRGPEARDDRSVPTGQVSAINNTSAGVGSNAVTTMWLLADHGHTARASLTTGDTTALLDLAPPKPSEGPHHSYAWQWRAFAVLVVAGWAALVRSELRQRRPSTSQATTGQPVNPA